MIQPSLFDCGPPSGVPADVWALFVAEADKIRRMGRDHYSARTILEFLRHHQFIDAGGREFIINNNWQAAIARQYMAVRNCPGFFETRQRAA